MYIYLIIYAIHLGAKTASIKKDGGKRKNKQTNKLGSSTYDQRREKSMENDERNEGETNWDQTVKQANERTR